ncbi:hypothetical protein [Ferrovibrio terrae]|uniref:hypothetical protein n=1 Tax=Ferrovibrio terrae TaxID=2594003 RepID=UPI0031382ECF
MRLLYNLAPGFMTLLMAAQPALLAGDQPLSGADPTASIAEDIARLRDELQSGLSRLPPEARQGTEHAQWPNFFNCFRGYWRNC